MRKRHNSINQVASSTCCAIEKNSSATTGVETSAEMTSDQPMVERKLTITGMRCRACVEKVRKILNEIDGVSAADVTLTDHTATVRFNPEITDVLKLIHKLTAAGYGAANSDSAQPKGKDAEPAGRLRRNIFWGGVAGLSVIGFYLGLITLVSDWENALYQFSQYGGWVISLVVGLGVQVGLFVHIRHVVAGQHIKGAASGVAASGGMSGVAMAACCAHYLAAVLPAIGLPFLSGALAGLAEYQTIFFVVGVISNMLGIAYMFRMMIRSGILVPATLLR